MRSSPGFLTCPKPLTEARPITEAGFGSGVADRGLAGLRFPGVR